MGEQPASQGQGSHNPPHSSSGPGRKARTQSSGCLAKWEKHGLGVRSLSACPGSSLCKTQHITTEPVAHTGQIWGVLHCPWAALHLLNPKVSWGLGWTGVKSSAYLTGLH